jgi:hypothetical protein
MAARSRTRPDTQSPPLPLRRGIAFGGKYRGARAGPDSRATLDDGLGPGHPPGSRLLWLASGAITYATRAG